MRHTILGAGGSIGNALTHELLKSKEEVRLVSRSNFSLQGTESYKADITSYQETLNSIKNSDIVYLCAGLPYDSKVWSDLWPNIMQNTIDACKSVNAKLIFFDNVYMPGKVNGKMIETTPYAARTSLPHVLAIDKLNNGKKAQWLIDDNKLHSYTYTMYSVEGLILLSNRDECNNEIWHLPTYNPAIDGKTFINLVAQELGVAPNYSVLKKWMVGLAGLVNKAVSESYEMLYQSEFE